MRTSRSVAVVFALLIASTATPALAQGRSDDTNAQRRQASARPYYDQQRSKTLAIRVATQQSSVATPEQAIGTALETTREVKVARDELKDSYARLSAYFKDLTPMPRLDELQEQEKISALLAFLENLIQTGEGALRDEAGFTAAFARYSMVVGKASVIFRTAAGHFRARARATKFETNREMNETIAGWYEARAVRHEQEGGAELPVTLEDEKEKLVESLEVVRHLRQMLLADPTFLAKDEALDLKSFRSNYSNLGDILKSWSRQLRGEVRQLDPQGSTQQPASPVSQEPVTPRGRPHIVFTSLITSLQGELPGGEGPPVGSIEPTSHTAPAASTSQAQLEELLASRESTPFALDKAGESPESTTAAAGDGPAAKGDLMKMSIFVGVVVAIGTVAIVMICRGDI